MFSSAHSLACFIAGEFSPAEYFDAVKNHKDNPSTVAPTDAMDAFLLEIPWTAAICKAANDTFHKHMHLEAYGQPELEAAPGDQSAPHKIPDGTPKCGFCNRFILAEQRSKCAACKWVYYCDKEHQLAHWKVHKLRCQRLQAAAAVTAAVAPNLDS